MHTGQFLDAIAYLAPTHLSIYLPSTYLPIHLSSTYLCEPEVNLQEPSGFDLQEPEPGSHRCRFSLSLYLIFVILLAPTGALVVMMVYYISEAATFSDFHSVH